MAQCVQQQQQVQNGASFSEELWQEAQPIFQGIMGHPFIVGLLDGSLPLDKFQYYVVQDLLYLETYARVVAMLGVKAPRPQILTLFCQQAQEIASAEASLHAQLLESWGISEDQAAAARLAPNCLLYTSYLTSVAHDRPYEEALAAVVPCYWVYLRVGQELKRRGPSPSALYQRWIDNYASPEFEAATQLVLRELDRSANSKQQQQQQEEGLKATMRRRFLDAFSMEYMFWDAAWTLQKWPF